MAFAAIHIPDFMVQSVARMQTAYRGRPIALIEGTPPQCKVVAANSAALHAGIQPGMAKSLAEQFSSVQIHRRSPSLEKSAHAALLDLGWSISPRVEDTAPDTMALDLAGLASLFGSPHAIASEITAKAARLSLAANVAVAPNIEAAILAARGFSGITVIPEGQEAACLGSLPVRALSLPGEMLNTLSLWGIHTCAALAALPVPELSERLGQAGVRLHAVARGASRRAILLAELETSFQEEMALEDSVEELEPLSFILGRLLDQLCARLDARALAVQSIRTRFHLETGQENSLTNHRRKGNRRSRGAPREKAASTFPAEARLYEKVLALPVPMRDSKMLLKLLRLQLQSDPPQSPVQKVMLSAEPAAARTMQEELFLPSSPDPAKLELTIARLANLVGGENIGSATIVDTHRPGEFRMNRFSVASGVSGKTKKRKSSDPSEAPIHSREGFENDSEKGSGKASIFRIFRPPLAARVTLHEGRPMKILFQGMGGDVLQASGPWRTSGDWWRQDAWHHDEWDLEISFAPLPASASLFSAPDQNRKLPGNRTQAVYRVHYDGLRGNWFVLGVYD